MNAADKDATMSDRESRLDLILQTAPVIPVYSPDAVDTAVEVARALVRGGLRVIEVTLRNTVAMDALRAIATQVPDAIVGAGTVLTKTQLDEACAAGAGFLVSPGCTTALLAASATTDVPLLPGIATASELMLGLAAGLRRFKFFPAAPAGGTAMLRAFAGPFPHVRFCPTGGITPDTAPDYLALPNVACIGGSWLTPADAIAASDWLRIERLAQAAARLRVAAL
jgi:2-dehydro-3-deoxyphosphogluconate aldolase/(4S)-4-hydroxy-2-oxoglutarate aldolase